MKNLERQFPNLFEIAKLIDFPSISNFSNKQKLNNCYTIWDLRDLAKKRTPKGAFDYTDGAAESETSLIRSRDVFQKIEFVPHILRNVEQVNTETKVLGKTFSLPFGIAPTGFTRLMNAEGEIAGAKAAEKFKIPFTLSTLGTTNIETVVKAAPTGSNWFQLYMWKDRDASLELVNQAKKAGVDTLILTVDVPAAGQRLRDHRNGLTIPPKINLKSILEAAPKFNWWVNFLSTAPLEFASMSKWNGTVGELLDYMFDPTMTWNDFKWLRDSWDGKLIIKGVQNLEDARMSADLGADAILLSNHGGRQLDRAPIMLHLLNEVKKELKNETEIHLDSGIMHGADILAAFALGANFTYIGRAYLYGLMAGGQLGVEKSLSILKGQIERNMKLLGVTELTQLEPGHVKFLS